MLSKRAKNQRQRAREYLEQRLTRHDFDDLGELYAQLDTQLPGAISRSTFYAWVKRWQQERSADQSGAWTLANDETGHPEIVMRVIAMLYGQSGGRATSVTTAEAKWLVRLGIALPAILEADDVVEWPDGRTMILWGTAKLLTAARRYIRAEQTGDIDRLLAEQANHAVYYTNEQRHLAELVGVDANVIAKSLDAGVPAEQEE